MPLTPIPSYKGLVDPYLLEQYKESVNLRGLLDLVMGQLDPAETGFQELLQLLDVSLAEGVQLDLLGRIANIPRDNRTDADYRTYLSVHFAVKLSGTPEDVIRMVQEAAGATRVRYSWEYPGGYWVAQEGGDTSLTQELLDVVSPAGVNGISVVELVDATGDMIVDANGDPIMVGGVGPYTWTEEDMGQKSIALPTPAAGDIIVGGYAFRSGILVAVQGVFRGGSGASAGVKVFSVADLSLGIAAWEAAGELLASGTITSYDDGDALVVSGTDIPLGSHLVIAVENLTGTPTFLHVSAQYIGMD